VSDTLTDRDLDYLRANYFDALEREFSPDYDRTRFEQLPTRDRLVAAARDRYSDVFACEASVA
jgi:hypothetical protein